jgi:hypothetical protein
MPFLLRSIALRPRCKVMACRVRASDVLLSCRNSASLKKHRMSWPTHKGPRSSCHYYRGALFPGLQTTTQSCRSTYCSKMSATVFDCSSQPSSHEREHPHGFASFRNNLQVSTKISAFQDVVTPCTPCQQRCCARAAVESRICGDAHRRPRLLVIH